MYHFIEDKEFLKRMKGLCSSIISQLVQSINSGTYMTVRADLVGSGAKNLVTQNANEPIDLDYNIIIGTKYVSLYTERDIKEYIKKQFNKILRNNGWGDCQESKSVLSTKRRTFRKGNKTEFSIDLAIIYEDENGSYRLIHEKSGVVSQDRYFWNKTPESKGVAKKVTVLKSNNLWLQVRETYLAKKNFYLCHNDHDHPSFIVYIETVNQVYYKYFT